MRAVVLLVALVGCGKPAAVPDGKEAPTEGKIPAAVPVPSGPPVEYRGEYQQGNPISADAKYKNKLVRFKNVEVNSVSRTKDGRAYAGTFMVLITTGVPEPTYFFFMSDEDAARVKVGASYDFTGVCLGYERDNWFRGGIGGMDWHVDFANCTFKPAAVPVKK